MAEIFDILEHSHALVALIRLLLAVIIGGAIGLERGSHNHPAGFRTHMLVCIGACLAMLTNEYVFENISSLSDPTRLGAQVITGVGFLGVGTIFMTGRHRIKGLTTAAGLWASACIGLALGIGFYAGAIIAALLVFAALAIFGKLELFFYNRSRRMDIYVELDSVKRIHSILAYLHSKNIDVRDTHFGSDATITGDIGLHMSLQIPPHKTHEEIIESISIQDGISLIEEL